MSASLAILFPYMARTGDVTVRVAVSFLSEQSAPQRGRWFWSYHIRIENGGAREVQLLARRWIITDGRGARHRVEGEGVVGAQPIIGPGERYDYVSGCPLDTPSGAMEGAYQLVDAEGRSFEAAIPRFHLAAPAEGRVKRTHLPLNGLRVLDAAARHLSFTRAADELAVTPAAVGQQVRAVEDTLGVVLFRRTAKGLELTPEGEAGLEPLRRGFLEFEEAVRAMQAGQSSRTLTIAAPRDLTAKWLAARLAAYGRTDPELRFKLVASDGGLDFTEANLDLAVLYAADKGEHEGVALAPAGLVAVGMAGGADRAIHWPGAPPTAGEPALVVADAGLAIDAAAAGFGRAVVPVLLAAADFATGRVERLGEAADARAYWLVAPVPQWRQKKVKALVAALVG